MLMFERKGKRERGQESTRTGYKARSVSSSRCVLFHADRIQNLLGNDFLMISFLLSRKARSERWEAVLEQRKAARTHALGLHITRVEVMRRTIPISQASPAASAIRSHKADSRIPRNGLLKDSFSAGLQTGAGERSSQPLSGLCLTQDPPEEPFSLSFELLRSICEVRYQRLWQDSDVTKVAKAHCYSSLDLTRMNDLEGDFFFFS